ncbi:MAG: ATP synthase F1 subunit gamma [Candidatus Cloacimonetes bacterium 4572_65]|nr:MAG: ATP synthase F1 subunit gamma [Candidatus Cloacimonetes bacterium 4572_65]
MANIKDLKQRIVSITNTRQITNAMKMVAAAKLRKAQNNAVSVRPYANEVAHMIAVLRAKQTLSDHPFMTLNTKKSKTLLVVVTGDKGLCGSFNSSILRQAEHYLAENSNCEIISIGKKGSDYFRKSKHTVLQEYIGLFHDFNIALTNEIAKKIRVHFLEDDYKDVVVIYNEFKSAIQNEVITKELLPVLPNEDLEYRKIEYLYEPEEDTIVDELIEKYVNIEIWRSFVESFAAENASRMTAMDNATENASDLISELSLEYNRERQASITTEIIEVSSGAEAINS